jgi:hypothetical protein
MNLKAANIPRFTTILIALIGLVSLSVAPLAFAQSDEGSTPSVSESDSIPGPPAPVADDLAGPPTSATDGFSGTADDSSGPPTSHTDWEEVPETIPGPPPPVADDLAGPPTSATDGFSGTAGRLLGDTHVAYGLEVPETNSEVIPGDGQVLEIPQSVNAAQAPNSDDSPLEP